MERKITIIEPITLNLPKRKRVAAYARVSSGKDAMIHSLSAQVSYYSELIQNHRDWEYIGVYADEALTGTKDNRAEFQRLLADCRKGLIDMVITKSISRFARNTVTMLETVRELKELNVDIYFEKENIHSTSGDGELMLTILASFAQEESLSVSENCKWRIRNRFKEGDHATLRCLYGYTINKKGVVKNESQAAVVRMIFEDYLSGMGAYKIAEKLCSLEVPTYYGCKWTAKRVYATLKNEKYIGDAILQKSFVSDHLTKKRKLNRGELPMYYAEATHPAIIDAESFEKVKIMLDEMNTRNNVKEKHTNTYPFSGMIKCPLCGKSYRRKTTRGRVSWNCSTYLIQGKKGCFGKQIPEDTLISVTTQMLGIKNFDEDTFRKHIEEIIVPSPNLLLFNFKDGRQVEATWQDRSRTESWDEASKQLARERKLESLRRVTNANCV